MFLSTFEYHMFYILYPFVIYLLTLPRIILHIFILMISGRSVSRLSGVNVPATTGGPVNLEVCTRT
jgi:hypothetical protein